MHGNFGLACPANDGSSGAPSATIQHPTLLSGYTKTITNTLGCNAPGVGYAVGYPTGQTFNVPGVNTLPSGASWNSSTHTISVTGSSLVTFNGWDFSNAAMLISSTGGVTITNSKSTGYPSGLSAGYIETESGAVGTLTITNSVWDGGGGNANGTGIPLVYNSAGSDNVPLVFEYNWVKNLPSLVIAELSAGSVTYKYNLVEDVALYPGEHLNMLEWSGTSVTVSATLQFNTLIQHLVGQAGGEMFQMYSNSTGMVVSSADIGYNTLIAPGVTSSAISRVNSTTYATGTVFLGSSIAGSIQTTYLVCAGSSWTGGVPCTGGTGQTCTTASSAPSGYTTAGVDVTFTDGTCLIEGSKYSVSYFLHGSNDGTTKLNPGPGNVHDNYFDATVAGSGALNDTSCDANQSVFYPSSWGTAASAVAWTAPSANFNMNTGGAVCATYPP